MSQNWVPDNPLVNKLNHMLTYQHSNLRGVCVCMYVYIYICQCVERYLVCLMFRRTISYVSIYVHIYVYIYIYIYTTHLVHIPNPYANYIFIYLYINSFMAVS